MVTHTPAEKAGSISYPSIIQMFDVQKGMYFKRWRGRGREGSP